MKEMFPNDLMLLGTSCQAKHNCLLYITDLSPYHAEVLVRVSTRSNIDLHHLLKRNMTKTCYVPGRILSFSCAIDAVDNTHDMFLLS